MPSDITQSCDQCGADPVIAEQLRAAAVAIDAGAALANFPLTIDGRRYLIVVVGEGPALELERS